jgi:hypothetical protein
LEKVDIFFLHCPDHETPINETIDKYVKNYGENKNLIYYKYLIIQKNKLKKYYFIVKIKILNQKFIKACII